MSWLRVHIDIERNDPVPIEEALLGLGAIAIELRDAGDDPILEPAPGATPLWPAIRMSALFTADVSDTTIRLAVAGAAAEPLPSMHFESFADADWIANWRQTLRPMQFGQRLWICPAGTPAPDPDATVIELEPGLAFGTGSHPTTAMCLDWLADEPNLAGSLLDYGCGSGILGIAAAALGADDVLGIDLDAQALQATRDNARRNGLDDRLEVRTPGNAPGDKRFDRVVANILSGTLIDLAPTLQGYCRAGTRIALSGILTDQAASVMAAFQPWVEFQPPVTRDGWTFLFGMVIAA